MEASPPFSRPPDPRRLPGEEYGHTGEGLRAGRVVVEDD
jgi:hypothetical protein